MAIARTNGNRVGFWLTMTSVIHRRTTSGGLALIAALLLLCAQTVSEVHVHGPTLDTACIACTASTASLPDAPTLPAPVQPALAIRLAGTVPPVRPAELPHTHPRGPPVR
ncbi:MAG TPA: hypothetical protein VIS76_15675 [Pseudomonadales bacterium]